MGNQSMMIGRADGLILLAVFAAFLAWMVMEAKKARNQSGEEEFAALNGWQCILYIMVGLGAIVAGGDFVVDSASAIAESFGLSPTLIGLTIVAFGTSLPELVTSLVAAKKGKPIWPLEMSSVPIFSISYWFLGWREQLVPWKS